MAKRQFANMSIAQLESMFDEKRDKPDVLKSLLAELMHRKVPRARNLRRRVSQALSVARYDSSVATLLKPVSPEDYRFAAEHFLKGQADWTIDERTEAAIIARQLVKLASMVEQRLAQPRDEQARIESTRTHTS